MNTVHTYLSEVLDVLDPQRAGDLSPAEYQRRTQTVQREISQLKRQVAALDPAVAALSDDSLMAEVQRMKLLKNNHDADTELETKLAAAQAEYDTLTRQKNALQDGYQAAQRMQQATTRFIHLRDWQRRQDTHAADAEHLATQSELDAEAEALHARIEALDAELNTATADLAPLLHLRQSLYTQIAAYFNMTVPVADAWMEQDTFLAALWQAEYTLNAEREALTEQITALQAEQVGWLAARADADARQARLNRPEVRSRGLWQAQMQIYGQSVSGAMDADDVFDVLWDNVRYERRKAAKGR